MEASPVSAVVAPIRIGCCARPADGAHKPKPRQRPTSQRFLIQSIFETFPDRLKSETEFARAMRHHMSILPTFGFEMYRLALSAKRFDTTERTIDIPQTRTARPTLAHFGEPSGKVSLHVRTRAGLLWGRERKSLPLF